MKMTGKKLGILISAGPEQMNFSRALRLAQAGLGEGVQVYLYFVDEAVRGLGSAEVEALKREGAKLFGCAYGAQRRHLVLGEQALFGGLTLVNELIAATDRFVSFN